MKEEATYLDLCSQVYELSRPEAPEDALEFYKSYADEAVGMILEPMCGTGCFLLPLIKDGYKVEGSDISISMLGILKDKADRMFLQANTYRALAGDIQPGKLYSLIFIPIGSFGLITDESEIISTLQSFYEHLYDDGTLVFEVETKHSLPDLNVWRSSKWIRADDKEILVSSYAALNGDVCSSEIKYELIDNDKVVKTEIEEHKVKVYEPHSLLTLLKNIGFRDVTVLKAYERDSRVCHSDMRVVYECYK